jgi:hypothetical protein
MNGGIINSVTRLHLVVRFYWTKNIVSLHSHWNFCEIRSLDKVNHNLYTGITTSLLPARVHLKNFYLHSSCQLTFNMRKSWKAAPSKPMIIFFCYRTVGTEAKSIKHRHVLRISDRHLVKFNVHVSVHRNSILKRVYIQQDATLHSLFYLETALHVSGGKSLIIRSAKQLYLQHLIFVTPYCYLPLSWNSWNWCWVCCGWRTPPTAHSNRFQLFHDSDR